MDDDWDILQRFAANRDQAAFAELARRHVDFVYGCARRMLGGPGQEAEDVAQAVFLLLAQKAGRIRQRGLLAGWLYRTTRYCCRNVKKIEGRRRKYDREASMQRPEAQAAAEDLLPMLDEALEALGRKEREAILSRFLERKTISEAATAMGISTAAAEKRVQRGMEKLRRIFAGKGFVVPAAGLGAILATESAHAAPAGLAATVAHTTLSASVTAAGIAKGTAMTMKMAKLKMAAAVLIAIIATASAGMTFLKHAVADPPRQAAAPTTAKSPPSTEPDALHHDAKQLFMQTIHELQTAKNLTLEATMDERTYAAEPVTNETHQAALNSIESNTIRLSLQRPGKLRFELSGTTEAADEDINSFITIFNHETLLIASFQDKGEPMTGRYGEMKNFTLDDILRSPASNIPVFVSEVPLLADSEADTYFFQFSTDWKWLGAGTDLGVKVWRVQMADAREHPVTWEAWITQASPHRFTRIISNGPSSYGFMTSDEHGGFEDNGTYKTTEHIELRLTKYDTRTPIPESVFDRPAGNFKETTFEESKRKYRIGDVVSLPQLENTDGTIVDLSKHNGPIILDFWFAACGPCMAWTPRVDALADEFAAQGVKLYGIDREDLPDKIKEVQAKQGWKRMTTLLDDQQEFTKELSVTSFPTVIVIGTDGKLLYRAYPGDPAAMGRLKEVLRKATQAAKPAAG